MYPLGRLSSQTWRFSSFWEHQFTDGGFLTGKIPAKNDLHAGGMTDLFRHESMVICVKLTATSRKQPHFNLSSGEIQVDEVTIQPDLCIALLKEAISIHKSSLRYLPTS